MCNPLLLIATVAAVMFSGCASNDVLVLDKAHRTPTQNVEILQNQEHPTKPYKSIAAFTFLGAREDEIKATKHFINKAKSLGADAIILDYHETFQKWVAWTPTTAVNYKATAIVYEK